MGILLKGTLLEKLMNSVNGNYVLQSYTRDETRMNHRDCYLHNNAASRRLSCPSIKVYLDQCSIKHGKKFQSNLPFKDIIM